jgi:hypothetical protein
VLCGVLFYYFGWCCSTVKTAIQFFFRIEFGGKTGPTLDTSFWLFFQSVKKIELRARAPIAALLALYSISKKN